jgi:hypothetical protein
MRFSRLHNNKSAGGGSGGSPVGALINVHPKQYRKNRKKPAILGDYRHLPDVTRANTRLPPAQHLFPAFSHARPLKVERPTPDVRYHKTLHGCFVHFQAPFDTGLGRLFTGCRLRWFTPPATFQTPLQGAFCYWLLATALSYSASYLEAHLASICRARNTPSGPIVPSTSAFDPSLKVSGIMS